MKRRKVKEHLGLDGRMIFTTRLKCVWGLDRSVGMATRYGLDGPGSNPDGGDIFHTRPERPWGPTRLPHNGYQTFLRAKAAGSWRRQPTPLSAEVKERVEYVWAFIDCSGLSFYLYLKCVFCVCVRACIYIQGVTGGTDQTSGGCSLC